jgi:hypothetical protein
MKAKFIILFIADTIIIILLTYFSLYEIDRHGFSGIIILPIAMAILAVGLLFRLYLSYIRRFPENSNLEHKK